MAKAQLEETSIIEKTIYRYGCITADQLAYFLPATQSVIKKCKDNENLHVSIVHHLETTRSAIMLEGIVYPHNKVNYKQEMIDSIWVMLDYLRYVENAPHPSNMLVRSLHAEHPCTLTFIPSTNPVIKTLCVSDASQITDIIFEQERLKTQYSDKEADVPVAGRHDRRHRGGQGAAGRGIPQRLPA